MDEIRDLRKKEKFVIDDEYLNGYARFCGINATGVYVSLCRHANKEQKCFPSKKLISEELKTSERTVYSALKTLALWNIIKIEGQGRKSDGSFRNNLYTLLDKSNWKNKPQANLADGKKQHTPQATDDIPRRQDVPNKETHKEGNTNKETHTIPAHGAGGQVPLLIDLFKEINPSYRILFSRPPQRAATERLLKLHDLEWWARFFPAYKIELENNQFCPRATTPIKLEEKIGDIGFYGKLKKEKNKIINPTPY